MTLAKSLAKAIVDLPLRYLPRIQFHESQSVCCFCNAVATSSGHVRHKKDCIVLVAREVLGNG